MTGSSTWDPSWRSFTAIQGGVVVGGALAAALHHVEPVVGGASRRAVVRAGTTHFLAGVAPAVPVAVRVQADRLGSTSSLRCETVQAGAVRAVTQVLTLVESDGAARRHDGDLSPGYPGPAEAEPLDQPVDFVPFTAHLEFRAVGRGRPLGGGPEARLTAWVRLRDPADLPDAETQLGVLADCLPPSLYAMLTAPVVVPTAELTLHAVGAPPELGAWVRVDQWTAWQAGGVCVDDATLHDEHGQLIGRVRQTRRLPR